jgi:hypothetical protein
MAKLKIIGFDKLVDLSNSGALELQKILDDDRYLNDKKIRIEGLDMPISKSQVKYLQIEKDRGENEHVKKIREYYKKRDELLALTPRERAEKTSWYYFSIFYQGITGQKPSETLREKLYSDVTDFFTTHMDWAKPSYEVFMKVMGVDNGVHINGFIKRFVSQVEGNEIQDIQSSKEFKLKADREPEDFVPGRRLKATEMF